MPCSPWRYYKTQVGKAQGHMSHEGSNDPVYTDRRSCYRWGRDAKRPLYSNIPRHSNRSRCAHRQSHSNILMENKWIVFGCYNCLMLMQNKVY